MNLRWKFELVVPDQLALGHHHEAKAAFKEVGKRQTIAGVAWSVGSKRQAEHICSAVDGACQDGSVIQERDETGSAVLRKERARWVRRYREGGVGLKRFAEQHGLRYSQLHYWIYGGQARARRRTAVEPRGSAPVLRELIVPARSERGWAAEISLPDGTSLRLGRGADPLWAGALLDQLRRPCSH